MADKLVRDVTDAELLGGDDEPSPEQAGVLADLEDNDKSEVEKNDIDKVELEQKIEELK